MPDHFAFTYPVEPGLELYRLIAVCVLSFFRNTMIEGLAAQVPEDLIDEAGALGDPRWMPGLMSDVQGPARVAIAILTQQRYLRVRSTRLHALKYPIQQDICKGPSDFRSTWVRHTSSTALLWSRSDVAL